METSSEMVVEEEAEVKEVEENKVDAEEDEVKEVEENKVEDTEKAEQAQPTKTENPQPEPKEPLIKSKMVHTHTLKAKAADQNCMLNTLDYEDCFKYYHIQLRIHKSDGSVLKKSIKVDLNDGARARLDQI